MNAVVTAAAAEDFSSALLAALHRIAQITAAPREPGVAARETLQILCEAAGFRAGHALVLHSGGLRSGGTFYGEGSALRDACAAAEHRAGAGVVGEAIGRRATAFSADLGGDPRAVALAAAGVRSELVCPVFIGANVIGVLELFSESAAPPDPRVVSAVEQAAVLLGGAGTRRLASSIESAEDMFRSLCESLPVGVILADGSGKALYCNPAMQAMTGIGPGSVAVEQWALLLHEDDRERAVSAWKSFAQTGAPYSIDVRLVRDGTVRSFEKFTSPMRGPAGELRGSLSVFEDVTARRTAEETVRQSEDRFRAIFENAGVGLALAVGDGDLVRVNRAYATFLGYEPDQLTGHNVREVLHPEDRARARQLREDLRQGKTARYEVERRYLRKDGSYVWGRSTVTRVRELIIAVVQDIDARKRAEDAVRALSGRFLRLQDEERRRIARSLHESAAQTVAALSMNLQRMERMALPQHAAEALADSLGLVTQVSREIRTLSHLLHPPLLEEAGLGPSLRWYVEGFGQRSNVEVQLHIGGDIGRLPMELEITLFRIVQESLTNVHRHSGSPSASIRLRRSGPEVVLEVEDEGIGIPADVLERVRTTSAATVGVGIAGMRERLSQLGGTLEIAPAQPGTLVRARIRSERS